MSDNQTSKALVGAGLFTLALQDVNGHSGLVVLGSREVCVFLVGMVVFFSIKAVITPPMVSIPRLSGVTSSSNTSLTSPDNTAPCSAAPTAQLHRG